MTAALAPDSQCSEPLSDTSANSPGRETGAPSEQKASDPTEPLPSENEDEPLEVESSKQEIQRFRVVSPEEQQQEESEARVKSSQEDVGASPMEEEDVEEVIRHAISALTDVQRRAQEAAESMDQDAKQEFRRRTRKATAKQDTRRVGSTLYKLQKEETAQDKLRRQPKRRASEFLERQRRQIPRVNR